MKFLTQDNTLSIELEGPEQLWALKSKIAVRKQDIRSIHYMPEFRAWRKWELRLPGTGLPGVLVAGSFWTDRGWDFLYLVKPKGFLNPVAYSVLVIETNLPKYHRIIVNCPADQVPPIMHWLGKHNHKE